MGGGSWRRTDASVAPPRQEADDRHVPGDAGEGAGAGPRPLAGFNHTHLTDKGVRLSRSTVRRVLLAGGVGSPRPAGRPSATRRERYPQEGMLLQIWLEGRGPYLN